RLRDRGCAARFTRTAARGVRACCAAPAPDELYTLSLHDALPISPARFRAAEAGVRGSAEGRAHGRVHRLSSVSERRPADPGSPRSEEHTSELQSRENLVCRLLLEKKKELRRQRKSQSKLIRAGAG